MKKVLLFSGGMDSYMAWNLLGKPIPLYLEIGHRYEEKESQVIQQLMRADDELVVVYSGRIFIGDLEEPDGHIPLRNLLFIQEAVLAGADTVYIGALRGESSQDKAGWFFRNTSRTLSKLMGKKIVVQAPFRGFTKSKLVREFIRCHPDKLDVLLMTRSCYNMAEVPEEFVGCGRCMACFRRWVAMTLNGIRENYQYPPYEWKVVQTEGWKSWLRYLRGVTLVELPGIIENNLEAAYAIRLAKEQGYV